MAPNAGRKPKQGKIAVGKRATGAPRKPSNDWLKVAYAETWKQYIHEDAAYQTRGTVFSAMFTAILAALAVISPSIVDVGCFPVGQTQIHLGLVLLGLLWFVVLAVLRGMAHSFEKVTAAARGYVAVRSATLQMIERAAGLRHYGPRTLEEKWRLLSSGERTEDERDATVGSLELEQLAAIPRYNFFGAFRFFMDIASGVRRATIGLGIVSALVVGAGIAAGAILGFIDKFCM